MSAVFVWWSALDLDEVRGRVVDLEGGVVDAVAVVEERLELAADAVGSRRRGGRARVR